MLKKYYFLILSLLIIFVPGAYAAPINSTINTPDEGFSFSATNRTNDVEFSEQSLQEWNDIISIQEPNIEPILFPIIVMIVFTVCLFVGLKSKDTAIAGMFFILSFVMSIVLILIFSGNLEFGIITEETTTSINTSTGLFEISKTYYTNKIIPNDTTFRPIFSMVFQLLFYFSMVAFVVKLFLMPMLEKRKKEKEA